jgi:L-ascorbate metabolism protein UlaG (beta-lactamase superfamily)
MEITYMGHSCFSIRTEGYKVLFDPFIQPNPLAASIDVESIEADFILVSHGHDDHTADLEMIAKRTGAVVVSNYEIVSYFQKKGVEKVHPMNHGGKWKFDFGTVHMVNAIHSSSFADGTYAGNPAGFVVQAAGKTFYYAGDTALHYDMKFIGEQYSIDFAMLPIGSNFTMDIADALRAADFVGTRKIIGMHYDTFPYIVIDHEKSIQTARKANKDLYLMNVGETISL